jgi:hydroxysqualene dehydroxylase
MAHVDRPLTELTVAVVGGGWAGCSAAAEAARAGARVLLLEAAADLGGRARRVELELHGTRHVLDNGQHLLLGAYAATASLLGELGIALDSVMQRRPFELAYADGFRLRAARLPAPWHLVLALATARGINAGDRIAMIGWLRNLKRNRWRVGLDHPAEAWLRNTGQSARMVARIWRPLLLAALNTPLPRASAQLFANVLRDSLGAAASASELWLPRADLSALLPEAVERFLLERGGTVRRSVRVDSIERIDDRFLLSLRDQEATTVTADRVIYAAPPAYLPRIARAHAAELSSIFQQVDQFVYEPIVTIYLKYATAVHLPRPLLALREEPAKHRWGQWVFDRGALDAGNHGVLAVVISASGEHQSRSQEQLCAEVGAQLSDELRLPAPLDARAIVEKRATLAAIPGLQRPRSETPIAGLALAGDWTDSEYPSTLETAVRNGKAAARSVLALR